MLTQIHPERSPLNRGAFVPKLLAPLVAAPKNWASLESTVLTITRSLKFDSFMYGASATPHPTHESKSYVFTTLPSAWVARYDQRAYIEVDPRVRHALQTSTPLIWDRASEGGRDSQTDAFLEDAAVHGVASGLAFAFHGVHAGIVLIALNSANPHIDEARRQDIAHGLGDVLLFGIYFHEIFMKNVINNGVAPGSQGAPLSEREKQCLRLAAHGQTTHDIAARLALTERTVQFHFDGIRSKLDAANRQEAIAKAIASGVIQP